MKSDDSVFKNCTKRSIIYETWCQTCLIKEKRKLLREYDVFGEENIDIENLYEDKDKNVGKKEKSGRRNR